MKGALVLEDGAVFAGEVFGAGNPQAKEVVCVAGVTWRDVITSPSYAGQIVVCVDAHSSPAGPDSGDCYPSGVLLNGVPPAVAREVAETWAIAGLCGVDTKALAGHLQRTGPLAGTLVAGVQLPSASGKSPKPGCPGRYTTAKPQEVSTDRPYRIYGGGARVVVYDFGLDPAMLAWLVGRDCQTTVVPWDYPAEDVLEMSPDAVVLSGGPGNPAQCDGLVNAFQPLLGQLPVLGVGLGHQLLARSQGGRTGQMWCGHRGNGVLVREVDTGVVAATRQSHGYSVLGYPTGARATHVAVADGSIEGLEYPELRAWSVQFIPTAGEAGSGFAERLWARVLTAAQTRSLSA
jgi:carbamoyl-phosphate synthase small subunit